MAVEEKSAEPQETDSPVGRADGPGTEGAREVEEKSTGPPGSEAPALRWYQRQAVDAVYAHLRTKRTNPLVVIPCGGGKSWILGQISVDTVERWGGRALVIAHRKELLEQNAEKLVRLSPGLDVGVYCAGLGRKDRGAAVTVASINSVWSKAADLGPFNLIAVDEVHRVPPEGEGMYRTFVEGSRKVNPQVVFVGLTATPYRMDSGLLHGPGRLFEDICYEAGVRELIVKRFLCPLISKAGVLTADTSDVSIRGGDFDPDELEQLMSEKRLVDAACREVVDLGSERRKCLLFACGVRHARMIRDKIEELGESCGTVSGETPAREREDILRAFREGELKYLSNCDILTTGFDAPQIDLIALLRPTRSPGLYSQMVGRGLRLCEGKENCLVLDYGGNVLRHGPIDDIRVPSAADERSERRNGEPPAKQCPRCGCFVGGRFSICPHCGYVWPRRVARHRTEASKLPPLSDDVGWHAVETIEYSVHQKRGAPPEHPRTLRVRYRCGPGQDISDFVCVEHQGWARRQAEIWWAARTRRPCPRDAESALEVAVAGELLEPSKLLIRHAPGEQFPSIVAYELPDEISCL